MIDKRTVSLFMLTCGYTTTCWKNGYLLGVGTHANMEGRLLTRPHPLTKNYWQLVTADKDLFNKDKPLIGYPTPNGHP